LSDDSKTTFISTSITSGELAATKSAILMVMIGSLACGVLAVSLSLMIGISLIIAIPGLMIGGFFAFKYAMYDKNKARKKEEEEERDQKHKRKRRNR
jgi:4-hydroxybenzoate polyprenyltransferase